MSKVGFCIEYPCKNASVPVLWSRIGTPLGLAEWFADGVTVCGDEYTFVWEKFEQTARLTDRKVNSHIRFQWTDDENTEAFFEIKIEKVMITGDLTLVITDYADVEEKDDIVLLWNKHVEQLRRKIGL